MWKQRKALVIILFIYFIGEPVCYLMFVPCWQQLSLLFTTWSRKTTVMPLLNYLRRKLSSCPDLAMIPKMLNVLGKNAWKSLHLIELIFLPQINQKSSTKEFVCPFQHCIRESVTFFNLVLPKIMQRKQKKKSQSHLGT